jgi:Protein of unknown function (DUF2652)
MGMDDSLRPRDPSVMGIGTGSRAARGPLLLADISGYTAFLQAVGAAHAAEMAAMDQPPPAYPLMTSLLDGIVERVTPPFRLSKLEGDAVFAYAPDEAFNLRGGSVIECMQYCYDSYCKRRDATENLMLCDCPACALLGTLELKFVLHHGDYVVQHIAGSEELLGPDVNMAHLLLKNTVTNVVERPAYALVTAPATKQLDVPVLGAFPHTENYAHYPPIDTFVFAL